MFRDRDSPTRSPSFYERFFLEISFRTVIEIVIVVVKM